MIGPSDLRTQRRIDVGDDQAHGYAGAGKLGDPLPLPHPVLLHYHIYKNAGSTIESQLWESFGDRFRIYDSTPEVDAITSAMMERYVADHPTVKAISSHKARPPLPRRSGVYPIVMLRHPVDRALSSYRFARRNPSLPDHAIARDGSFRDYVEWALATYGHGATLRNHQVFHLSPASFRDSKESPTSRNDLVRVKALLTDWPAFGLVRRFADSCTLFNTMYRPIFPAFRLLDVSENETGTVHHSDEEAIEEVRGELGEEAYAKLLAENVFDLQLYEFASGLFAEKLARLDARVARVGWRLALEVGRLRQRLFEPRLYRAGPVVHGDEPARD